MYFICSSWLFTRIFSAKIALKNRSTIFTLGSRGNVLTSELEEPVIVPHAAQKTEKKVGDVSFWMKKKNLDKKEQTNNNQRRRRQKIQDRVHPFVFAMLTFLVKIILFYTRVENIYIFLPLLLRLDTRAQFTSSSKRIAEEQRDLNSLEEIHKDFFPFGVIIMVYWHL